MFAYIHIDTYIHTNTRVYVYIYIYIYVTYVYAYYRNIDGRLLPSPRQLPRFPSYSATELSIYYFLEHKHTKSIAGIWDLGIRV